MTSNTLLALQGSKVWEIEAALKLAEERSQDYLAKIIRDALDVELSVLTYFLMYELATKGTA